MAKMKKLGTILILIFIILWAIVVLTQMNTRLKKPEPRFISTPDTIPKDFCHEHPERCELGK